jgi:hypothetical protein
MRYVVLEAFKTPIHRFHVDDVVDDSEIDGMFTALQWADMGKLGPVAAEDEDVSALQAEAADLGIQIDGRWGASRLRQEIEAVKATMVPVEPVAPVVEPTIIDVAPAPAEEVVEEPPARRRR